MINKNKNCEIIVKQCLIELLCTHEPFENEIVDYTINTLINYLIHICKCNPEDVMNYTKSLCKKLGKDVKLLLLNEDDFNYLDNSIKNKPKLLN